MATFKQIMREIFSDGSTGVLSSKRVIGGISMAVVLICTCYLVIRDGSTDVVEDLLMTIFITSASLLGLPAIAGAWGKAKVHIGNVEHIKQETHSECYLIRVYIYNNVDEKNKRQALPIFA